MAILTAYIFGLKHDIDNRASALTTTVGLLHRPNNDMNFGPQMASSWTASFTHPKILFSTSLLGFADRDSKWNSTKLC